MPKPTPLVVAVDDVPSLLKIYRSVFFKLYNANVVTTDNNEEALKLAVQKNPDLLITDLVRPSGSGLELIRALRQGPSTMYMPIWVISGQAQGKLGRRAKLLGANLIITKPFASNTIKDNGDILFKMQRNGRFDYLFDLSSEQQDIDFKREMGSSKDSVAAIAKDIIAIANYGGGHLVFGFSEKIKGEYTPVGLNSDQISQLEVTVLNKAIREYIDPHHAVISHKVVKNGLSFIVVEIPAANDCILLARKQNDTAGLYLGRIYSRTTACESAELRESHELRRIMERTSIKINERRSQNIA